MSTLSRQQLQRALELLNVEERHYLLTRRQRFGLMLLTVAINLFLAAVVLYVLHLVVEFVLGGDSHWDLLHEVLTVVFVALIAGIPILFLLCLPSIERALGRIRLARRLGLEALLPTPWESMGRVSRLLHAVGWILLPGGVLVALLGGASFVSGLFWRAGEVQVSGLAVILFGVLMVLGPFLARLRARYKLISELPQIRASLQQTWMQSTAGGLDRIEVDSHQIKQLAAFEKAEIVRDRAEAIKLSYERGSGGYSVVRSTAYKASADELPAEDRRKLQQHVQELMFTPRPEGSRQVADGEQWSAPVPDTDLVVRYSVDEDEQRIFLLSVGARAESARRNSDAERDDV